MDLIVGGSVTLGSPSALPRPSVPDVTSVTTPALRPPVGYIATVGVTPVPLALVRTVTSNTEGHTVTLALVNSFAPIFYTLDGTSPVNSETTSSKRYIAPVAVKYPTYLRDGAMVTFKAQAFALAGSGFDNSAVDSFSLQIPRKPALTFTVDNTADPLVKDITITADFSGDFAIRYTTDGTIPTGTSPSYAAPFQLALTLGGAKTLKAIAFPNVVIGLTGGVIQSDVFSLVVSAIP